MKNLLQNPVFEDLGKAKQLFKKETNLSLRMHRNVDHMSLLMNRADMAISAGGSTCYELARCGVPTLVVSIANNQIPEVPGTVLFSFFLAINIAEAFRANTGWVEPGLGPLFTLREGYYPGDIKFDPLGLKPTDGKEFATMQTKELNNGRLAMLGAAGMCAQEVVNGKGILENLGF